MRKVGIREKVGKVVIDDRPQIPKSPGLGTVVGTIRGEIVEQIRTLVTERPAVGTRTVPKWLWAEEIPSPDRPHKRRRRRYREDQDFERYLRANGPVARSVMLTDLNQGDDMCSASTLDRWVKLERRVTKQRRGRELFLIWTQDDEL